LYENIIFRFGSIDPVVFKVVIKMWKIYGDIYTMYMCIYQVITIDHQNHLWQFVTCNGVRVMVFNATFNNISVISWWSVLLVEETGVFWENHRPVASHWQTLSHNVVSGTPRLNGIRTCNVSGDRHRLHK
jgi:hypothetical protein